MKFFDHLAVIGPLALVVSAIIYMLFGAPDAYLAGTFQ